MTRRWQIVLVVCLLADCWMAMQIVHESGHVFGAWLTGGTVAKVVLLPWTLSRTELAANPHPFFVTWAGPVAGAAAPLLAWLGAAAVRCPGTYLLRFFAGFCLLANGAYLGGGAFRHVGDAGDLQRHGSPLWLLLGIAALAAPAGLWLWHGQGRYFGFGGAKGWVSRRATIASAVALLVLVAAELLWASDY